MPSFPIFDPHLHLWDRSELDYPWLEQVTPLNQDFLLSRYREACEDIDVGQMVFMQCDCLPEQGITEATWAHALQTEDPRLAGVIAYAPVEKGESVAQYLTELKEKCPSLLGIRRLLQGEAPGFGSSPDFVQGIKQVTKQGLTFDLCFTEGQIEEVVQLARQLPEAKLVIDHLGKPNIKDQQFNGWAKGMAQLAEMGNVYCKLSSLATEADWTNWTPEDLRPYLDHVLEQFGSQRCFFASDWPVCTLAADFPTCVRTLEGLLSGASEEELKGIFWENGRQFYGVTR